jgi:hypothetical protein
MTNKEAQAQFELAYAAAYLLEHDGGNESTAKKAILEARKAWMLYNDAQINLRRAYDGSSWGEW